MCSVLYFRCVYCELLDVASHMLTTGVKGSNEISFQFNEMLVDNENLGSSLLQEFQR